MSYTFERKIGTYGHGNQGPLLFFIGGIHGNEPSGVFALRRVFHKLEEVKPAFYGKIIGLSGNCTALAREQRYIDRDLNRLWSAGEVERILALKAEERNSEEKEMVELLRYMEAAIKSDYEPQIFVDLHTTSGRGGLFSIITDDPQNRRLAEKLYAPIVFNLVDELALTTNKFFENRGLIGMAFESGQHHDPISIDLHEAAIWVLMAECGCVYKEDIPDYHIYPERLRLATENMARYVRVTYRHDISPEDEFTMNDGYENFQRIQAGEPLGKDRQGVIAAPSEGLVLMPLYQKQGEDGFFVIEELDQPPV